MLIENMIMAFSALRANKMRSFLTMLGIIIGIGSVISIVSIGDTMRGMFSSLYQDIGITQAYLGIGYWIDDTRQSDYFTMDELSRIKSVFGDKISYIDSAMSTSADADAGFAADPREESVADLRQDAHSVSGSALGVLSGPVLQMLHDSQRVRHDLVALFPFYIDHGSDSTVVVFKSGTVQPLLSPALTHACSSSFL